MAAEIEAPVELTTEEAAKFLKVKPGTLEVWRSKGGGPVFSKPGKVVYYAMEDLVRWKQSIRMKTTTSPADDVEE